MNTAQMRIAGETEKTLPRKIAFTVEALRNVRCPSGKQRVYVFDSRTPRLAYAVTSNDARAFYLVYKLAGRKRRYRLGGDEITIEQARKQAAVANGMIAKGIDPMQEKKAARARQMTLGELWEWFLANHAKPRKRSWRADEIRYGTHLKAWEKRELGDITQADVASLHQKVADATSQPTANRVLALLRTMFNKAGKCGWTGGNPCKGVAGFDETSRERFLSGDEVQKLLAVLDAEVDPTWRDLFKVCLFTGARRGNVQAMRWAELDLEAGRWLVPQTKFKNKTPGAVYLAPVVVELLKARKKRGEWVFPANSKSGHVERPEHAWARIAKAAGLADVRPHDLRRTLGSWQAAGGSSLNVIGKSLGHSSVQATQIYARLQLDPVKKSVDSAIVAMQATAKPQESEKT